MLPASPHLDPQQPPSLIDAPMGLTFWLDDRASYGHDKRHTAIDLLATLALRRLDVPARVFFNHHVGHVPSQDGIPILAKFSAANESF